MTEPIPPSHPNLHPGSDPATPVPAPLRTPAPEPVGEVVPGYPPVPITVWYIPEPPAGTLLSTLLTRRLAANYALPGATVIDLVTATRDISVAATEPATLIVTGWPIAVAATPDEPLTAIAGWLAPGGSLAVVLPSTETPEQLGHVVGAARAAGLTYLQHVVVAHVFRQRSQVPHPAAVAGRHRSDRPLREGRHLRVHTDALIFSRSRGRS